MNINNFEEESKCYFERNYSGKNIAELGPNLFLFNMLKNYNISNYTVFEIGCGAGNNLRWLKDVFNCECIGAETNQEVVNILSKTHNDIQFLKADIINLPFPNDRFDLVICRSVLHWVNRNNILQAAGELLRVSKSYILISDFFPSSPFKTLYKHKDHFYTYHIDYVPLFINTGIIDLVESSIGRIAIKNNKPKFVKISKLKQKKGQYDWEIVKTSLLKKNLLKIPIKKERDFFYE